jgi:hypothetical protein
MVTLNLNAKHPLLKRSPLRPFAGIRSAVLKGKSKTSAGIRSATRGVFAKCPSPSTILGPGHGYNQHRHICWYTRSSTYSAGHGGYQQMWRCGLYPCPGAGNVYWSHAKPSPWMRLTATFKLFLYFKLSHYSQIRLAPCRYCSTAPRQ